jgi:hypothetical protein
VSTAELVTLLVAVAVFLYLGYALLRGENL